LQRPAGILLNFSQAMAGIDRGEVECVRGAVRLQDTTIGDDYRRAAARQYGFLAGIAAIQNVGRGDEIHLFDQAVFLIIYDDYQAARHGRDVRRAPRTGQLYLCVIHIADVGGIDIAKVNHSAPLLKPDWTPPLHKSP